MDQWLSIVDYARKNMISDMTVRRRIKSGKIQAVLKDGKYYIQTDKNDTNHDKLDIDLENNDLTDKKPSFKSINIDKDKDRDINSILSFCKDTINKIQENNISREKEFKNNIKDLNARLLDKNIEINNLKKKIEDLKLLIDILEENDENSVKKAI